MHDGVHCADERSEELVNRGDEVGDGVCDGHFNGVAVFGLSLGWWCGVLELVVGLVLVQRFEVVKSFYKLGSCVVLMR